MKQKPQSNGLQLNVFGALSELVRQYPVGFLALLCVTTLQSAINASSILVVAPIVDLLFDGSGASSSHITEFLFSSGESFGVPLTAGNLFFAFGIMLIGGGILGVLTKLLILRIKYHVLEDLLSSTLGCFFSAGYEFFGTGEIGKLLNSFQKEVEKLGDSLGLTVTGIVSLSQGFVYLAIPLYLYPLMSLRFIVIASILVLPLLILKRVAVKFGDANTKTSNLVMKRIHEAVAGAKVIIAFGGEAHTEDLYRKAFSAHARAAVAFATLVSSITTLFVPLGSVAALIVVFQAYQIGQGVSDLALVLFGFFRGLPHLAAAVQAKTSIEGFLPAFSQVHELRDQAMRFTVPDGDREFSGLTNSIDFEHVSFSYPEASSSEALKDVNIKIMAGEITVFVGASGSGKTTTLDLMLGLYSPSGGRILLDNVPLNQLKRGSYRNKVGYVPQDPYLFDESIEKNLIWADQSASKERIEEAVQAANLDEVISRLSNGLQTRVGDRGSLLSGGQRQRVALARALLREPDLLLLDEVTSALDERAASSVVQAVNHLRGMVTIVICTHRRETMKVADKIVVFDEGRVVNVGTYRQMEGVLDTLLSS